MSVLRGNDAVEWSDDAFVALKLFQAAHVSPAGVDSGLGSDVVGASLVCLLL